MPGSGAPPSAWLAPDLSDRGSPPRRWVHVSVLSSRGMLFDLVSFVRAGLALSMVLFPCSGTVVVLFLGRRGSRVGCRQSTRKEGRWQQTKGATSLKMCVVIGIIIDLPKLSRRTCIFGHCIDTVESTDQRQTRLNCSPCVCANWLADYYGEDIVSECLAGLSWKRQRKEKRRKKK